MSAMVEPRADLNVRTVHTLTTYDLRQELNRRGEFERFFPGDDASAPPLPFFCSCAMRRFRRPMSPPNLRVSDSTVSWASVAS